MKIDNTIDKEYGFRVWCEHCSIRIAPNEESVALDGKTYHQRCYTKYYAVVPKMKITSSRSRGIHGDKK